MKKYLIFLLVSFASYAQETSEKYYLEDQLYITVVLNTFRVVPDSYHETGFSYGYQIGFVRDFPINQRRNIGFGVGLGYAYDYYRNNIGLEGGSLKWMQKNTDNRFAFHSIALPFELRWRNSTVEKYNFWRIYIGFQVAYTFTHNYYIRKTEVQQGQTDILNQINKLQYGISLSIGYGSLNFYTYYGLTSLFKDNVTVQNMPLNTRSLQIGIRFFIL